MTEPRHAYIASTTTIESIQANGFGRPSGSTEMYLSATEAIDREVKYLYLKPDDSVLLNDYEIDLSNLDGMWPRVTPYSYNDFRLQWSCGYDGKIPARVFKLVNSLRVHGFPENAKIPPTIEADGEVAGLING